MFSISLILAETDSPNQSVGLVPGFPEAQEGAELCGTDPKVAAMSVQEYRKKIFTNQRTSSFRN